VYAQWRSSDQQMVQPAFQPLNCIWAGIFPEFYPPLMVTDRAHPRHAQATEPGPPPSHPGAYGTANILTPGDTSVYQIGISKIVLVLKEGFPQETNSPADSRATALSLGNQAGKIRAKSDFDNMRELLQQAKNATYCSSLSWDHIFFLSLSDQCPAGMIDS
jgi:hypothetical protein